MNEIELFKNSFFIIFTHMGKGLSVYCVRKIKKTRNYAKTLVNVIKRDWKMEEIEVLRELFRIDH